jgi:uncharacterized protein YwqG
MEKKMNNITTKEENKLLNGSNKDKLKLYQIWKEEINNGIRSEIFGLDNLIDDLEKKINFEIEEIQNEIEDAENDFARAKINLDRKKSKLAFYRNFNKAALYIEKNNEPFFGQ